MNDRMREISKLSGLWFVVDREDLVESFGKLLIAECAQKLEDDGMVEVAVEIKEYFGVE